MGNVRACALDRKTQLPVQNKKLVGLDTELCCSFAKESLIEKKEQSLIFLICYEFIRISRSFRYSSKTIKSLPLFVTESFSRGSQQIIDEFSVLVQETLYYIAGWTIHAASKTS